MQTGDILECTFKRVVSTRTRTRVRYVTMHNENGAINGRGGSWEGCSIVQSSLVCLSASHRRSIYIAVCGPGDNRQWGRVVVIYLGHCNRKLIFSFYIY